MYTRYMYLIYLRSCDQFPIILGLVKLRKKSNQRAQTKKIFVVHKPIPQSLRIIGVAMAEKMWKLILKS